MVISPKVSAVLLSLGLVVSLAACSSGKDRPASVVEAGQSKSSSTPKGDDDFSQGGMVVTAQCAPAGDSGGGTVTVDGWDSQSLQKMAHAEFQLPETVLTKSEKARPGTALEDICAPTNLTDSSDILAVRSLFDRDFTKLAVVIEDPQSKATHIGYVDRSGKLTDLTGEEDFSNTPHEDNAAMAPDGNAVWFTSEVDGDDHIASRSVTGDHKPANEQPIEYVGDHLFVVGNPGSAVMGDRARLSPDGKCVLVDDKVVELSSDSRVIGKDAIDRAPDAGCMKVGSSSGQAVGWVDDDTVLCSGPDERFSTLDVTPNATRSAPILPSNDRNNYILGISPDGQKFAFLSVKEEKRDYYVSDVKPGSTPTKVGPPADFAQMLGKLFVLDWR